MCEVFLKIIKGTCFFGYKTKDKRARALELLDSLGLDEEEAML